MDYVLYGTPCIIVFIYILNKRTKVEAEVSTMHGVKPLEPPVTMDDYVRALYSES